MFRVFPVTVSIVGLDDGVSMVFVFLVLCWLLFSLHGVFACIVVLAGNLLLHFAEVDR